MKMSLVRRFAAYSALFVLFCSPCLAADPSSLLKNLDAGADVYEYVGDNLIARGHVVIRTGDIKVSAERAVINLTSHDIEAAGNVTVTRTLTEVRLVGPAEYKILLNDFSKKIERLGEEIDPVGLKKIRVRITQIYTYAKADRIAGNLKSGVFRFKDFALKSKVLYAAASYAERQQDGKITIENGRFTTCDYIMDDHDHYAITVDKAVLKPRHYESGLQNYNTSHNRHSILAYNTLLRFWDIPVLWLPVLYKPQDSDTFGGDIAIGQSSNWGFWVRTAKGFTLHDDPYINVTGFLDYYTSRGLGWGGSGTFMTGNSRTEIFAYSIYDRNPYENWNTSTSDSSDWYERNTPLSIPHGRYDIKVTNLTHLTNRLDFRGQFELLSDYNFLYDYFKNRYRNDNIQPPTYAALEYQHDRFSASIYTTVQVNDFYTTLQRLPEARLDFPRQELFGGLYHQGESSAAYLDMRWTKFDQENSYGKINNYSSGRFDTMHFLYYPIRLDFLNIVPRAGIRATTYTAKINGSYSDEQYFKLFSADNTDFRVYNNAIPFTNPDVSNQAAFRLMEEVGVEINTKIYRSWNNVRNSYLGLDGLRHVAVPYINYTWIPEPTLSSEEILYFDDNDRLKRQHFIRFGLENRLQTREGAYGQERIREWMLLENYWDFHVERSQGFNNVGDLGTRIKLTPFEGLTLTSELLLDIGQNNEHESEATRANGREAGRVGLSQLDWINRWETTLSYQISSEWKIKASYLYSDTYEARSTYSMGSMITALNNSTSSLSAYYPRSQKFILDLSFPTYIDPKMTGGIFCEYDVDAALMRNIGFRLIRKLHCFNIMLEAGRSTTLDSDQDKSISYYIGGSIALSAMPGAAIKLKSNL